VTLDKPRHQYCTCQPVVVPDIAPLVSAIRTADGEYLANLHGNMCRFRQDWVHRDNILCSENRDLRHLILRWFNYS
jgi:hypothetical protein